MSAAPRDPTFPSDNRVPSRARDSTAAFSATGSYIDVASQRASYISVGYKETTIHARS